MVDTRDMTEDSLKADHVLKRTCHTEGKKKPLSQIEA